MAPKRKRTTAAALEAHVDTNPDQNEDILDGKSALRASPDADEKGESLNVSKITGKNKRSKGVANLESVKAELLQKEEGNAELEPSPKKLKKTPTKASVAAKKGSDEIKAFRAQQEALKAEAKKAGGIKQEEEEPKDPEAEDEDVLEDVDAEKREAGRPPPVNSDYLPLPWKGRLGYACLNTYLRFSNPPVFSSRTCRIASILEHRHPLKDPSQPEHVTKNRPDKSQPADTRRGMQYVEDIGLANARDIVKMIRWNEKFGIKFMRLSSEMFPFASHDEYGYNLAPFASEVLAEAGKVAGELGHRLTTHPGQFTQLGSPRQAVIDNAIRDLVYHAELLSLLKLPPQQDRDAVMILHLGGTFGDKQATLDRFKANYIKLSQHVKDRLVLENDDVSWSVHDLLPVCEELNIPMVLDFHHHNIIFDSDKLREGTKDIMDLFPRILATWTRKGITPKMHYSEPTPQAITGRQRRKHNPRPATLPPCPPDMDLMIEAKDKEQAVFELMRTFRLPGFNSFSNLIPYERADDNKPEPKKAKKKKTKKQLKMEEEDPSLVEPEEPERVPIPEDDVGMGGPLGRVYWPPGMEEWLRPKKREVKKKGPTEEELDNAVMANPTPMNLEQRQEIKAKRKVQAEAAQAGGAEGDSVENEQVDKSIKVTTLTPGRKMSSKPKAKKVTQTSISSDEDDLTVEEDEEDDELSIPDLSDGTPAPSDSRNVGNSGSRQSARKSKVKQTSYAEASESDLSM